VVNTSKVGTAKVDASRSFRRLVGISASTVLILSLAFLGPLIVGSILHHDHVVDVMQDIVLVCLLQPTLADWSVLFLMLGPLVILLALVLGGLWLLISQQIKSIRVLRSLFSLSAPVDQQSWAPMLPRLGLQGRVDYVAVERPLAFCYGWLRPRICVAQGALTGLSSSEVEALLLHERYHLLRRDPLKSAISTVLARLFFFIPAVRAVKDEYLVAREIEADRHVLASQQDETALLSALYKLVLRHRPGQGSIALATAVTVGAGTPGYGDCIGPRLNYLLEGKLPAGIGLPPVVLSAVVLSLCALTVTAAIWVSAANAMWHQTYCMLNTCPLMH
jgi:hypothetical protein